MCIITYVYACLQNLANLYYVHIGAHHWLCVCHVRRNKVVFILDSLPVSNDLTDETIFQICKIYSPLSSKKRILTLQKLSTQRQCNDVDCRLFAIGYMSWKQS